MLTKDKKQEIQFIKVNYHTTETLKGRIPMVELWVTTSEKWKVTNYCFKFNGFIKVNDTIKPVRFEKKENGVWLEVRPDKLELFLSLLYEDGEDGFIRTEGLRQFIKNDLQSLKRQIYASYLVNYKKVHDRPVNKISRRNEIKEYLERCERVTYIEEIEDGIIFIFENMQFTVDYNRDIYIQSRWNRFGEASELISHLEWIRDNIDYAETFGILSKEDYMDQIFIRSGW